MSAFRRQNALHHAENPCNPAGKEGSAGSFFFRETSDFKALERFFLPTPAGAPQLSHEHKDRTHRAPDIASRLDGDLTTLAEIFEIVNIFLHILISLDMFARPAKSPRALRVPCS
jgi:hypothetical protein